MYGTIYALPVIDDTACRCGGSLKKTRLGARERIRARTSGEGSLMRKRTRTHAMALAIFCSRSDGASPLQQVLTETSMAFANSARSRVALIRYALASLI